VALGLFVVVLAVVFLVLGVRVDPGHIGGAPTMELFWALTAPAPPSYRTRHIIQRKNND
jgi:hypothetical protein